MHEYDNMTPQELEKKQNELKNLLEEVEEERMIILGQENLHISSKTVKRYEDEINDIKEAIAQCNRLLKVKDK